MGPTDPLKRIITIPRSIEAFPRSMEGAKLTVGGYKTLQTL